MRFRLSSPASLARRGHDVLLLQLARSCPARVGSSASRRPARPRVRQCRPRRRVREVRRAAPDRARTPQSGSELARRIAAFRPEVVLSNAPLLVQARAAGAARALGAGFVFWQQDVISAAARRVLGRRSRPLGAAAQRAVAPSSGGCCGGATGSWSSPATFCRCSDGWGVDEERVTVIENWAPLDELPVLPRDNEWAREHGTGGQDVFLYSGTLGFKHDPVVLELARWAGARETVVLVVSEGPGADWLAREHAASRRSGSSLPALRAPAGGSGVRGRPRRGPRARRGRVLGALEGADLSLRRAAAARRGGAETTSPRAWSSAAAAGSSSLRRSPEP